MVMQHDPNYRRLFTHRAMIEALLTHHVDSELTQGLMFGEAECEESVFIRPDLNRFESDMIWRIPHAAGEDVYVCLLLEFQSSTRHTQWMSVRMLQYAVLIWERLIEQGKVDEQPRRLPPILPVVVYNGERRWTAATDMHTLVFEQVRGAYAPYTPQGRYLLLDIGAMTERMLASKTDPASLLMRFERASNVEEFEALLKLVTEHLSDREQQELVRIGMSMKTWLAHLARFRDYIDKGSVDEIINAEEVDMGMTLLEASMERWKREHKEEGVLQGQRATLAKQMEVKFGPDAERAERIEALEAEALEQALVRILTADHEDEVFGER